jgi:hypothetical protein
MQVGQTAETQFDVINVAFEGKADMGWYTANVRF